MTEKEFLALRFDVDGAALVMFAGMAVGIYRQYYRECGEPLAGHEMDSFARMFARAVLTEAGQQKFATSVQSDIAALPTTDEDRP